MKLFTSKFVSLFASRDTTAKNKRGVTKTEQRDISQFSEINVSGAIKVDLKLGEKRRSVSVTGLENLVSLISTELVGSTLHIQPKPSLPYDSRILVSLSTFEISAVRVHGAASVSIDGVDQASLKLTVSGSGSIKSTGMAKGVEMRVSGSGEIIGTSLETDDLIAKVSGSGLVKARATSSAKLDVCGAGVIKVKGSPMSIENKRTGSGSITVSG